MHDAVTHPVHGNAHDMEVQRMYKLCEKGDSESMLGWQCLGDAAPNHRAQPYCKGGELLRDTAMAGEGGGGGG